jgi:hypothetical protein
MKTEQEARDFINGKNNIDWVYICEKFKLSEAFIEEFADKVNWFYISVYQKLSEPFIRKFADKVDWLYISSCQTLSEAFIEEFADKVDWEEISIHQELSEDFMIKNRNRINFGLLKNNKKSKITYALYSQLKDKILLTDVKFDYKTIESLVKANNINILKYLEKAPRNILNYIGKQIG